MHESHLGDDAAMLGFGDPQHDFEDVGLLEIQEDQQADADEQHIQKCPAVEAADARLQPDVAELGAVRIVHGVPYDSSVQNERNLYARGRCPDQ